MNLRYSALVLIGSIVLSSCGGDDGDITQPTPTAGNISGEVNLYDEGTTEIDGSGMTIRLEGTSSSATTDASGNFVLTDVPFGSYTLVFEKGGYGTFRSFDFEHRSEITFVVPNPSLGQSSTTSITDLTVSSDGTTVTVGATTDPEASIGNTRYVRFFFSTTSDVSSEDYDAVLETIQVQITPYNLNLTAASLEALGFTSGQTVYVRAYGESFWSNQYDDPDLGRTVFPNLNMTSAAAVSLEVP